MTYKDNQPTFNVNRNVVNFKDFKANFDEEKEKLKKAKRSFVPDSDQKQVLDDEQKEYDPVTHKLTDYTKDEIEDKLNAMDDRFDEEFDWDEVLKGQRKEGEKDHWSDLEKDLMEIADKYSGKFGPDSYGVVDAMYQVLDGMFPKK